MKAAFRADRTDFDCYSFVCDSCGKSVVAIKYESGKAVAWSSDHGWRQEALEIGDPFPLEGWLSLALGASYQDPLFQHRDMLVCSRECAHTWIDDRYTVFANGG